MGTREETDRESGAGNHDTQDCDCKIRPEGVQLEGDGAAPDEHEGEVDPDELEIAIYLIEDAMGADIGFARVVASIMGQLDGINDVKTFAAARPQLTIALADTATDFVDNWEAILARAIAKHGEAQRELAEKAGYSRDVWHRPPAPPTEI
jgi:hypothetical protein